MAPVVFTFFAPVAASLLLGVVYPVYKSLQAIESMEPHAITQWLAYWVLFGASCVLEQLLGVLLRWLPFSFYWVGKAVVLLWLTAPHTEGASFVYRSKLRPLLAAHGKAVGLHVGGGGAGAARGGGSGPSSAGGSQVGSLGPSRESSGKKIM